MVDTYLPYIMRDVVAQVNTIFSARAVDPFNVFFDYGMYVDVAKNIYNKENAGLEDANIYPLVWLVDDWRVNRGMSGGYYGEITFQIIIGMPTSNEYTSDERSDKVFLPRLFPIYDKLLYAISKSKSFAIQSTSSIKHTLEKRSYWGGNEGGADTKNLFKNFIDALHIPTITVTMKEKDLC